MAYDHERVKRDHFTEDEWKRRWDAGEKNLICWRGDDGEKHIYTSEQFGPGRIGHGPTVGGRVGWTVWIVTSFVGFLVLNWAILTGPGDAPLYVHLFFTVMPLGLALYGIRGLRKELHARKLRTAAGLPEPISR